MALPLAIARQPAWTFGGLVVNLVEEQAIQMARRTVEPLHVSEAILAQHEQWQEIFSVGNSTAR